MIKYSVASDTTVLNNEEAGTVATLKYANQIRMQNAEMSDTTRGKRLVVASTREPNTNSPNAAPIACGVIHRPTGPPPVHVLNASSGMSGSDTANVLHELSGRGYPTQ